MKPQFIKILIIVLAVIGFVLIGFLVYGYVLLEKSLPETSGMLEISEIKRPLEISFDAMGIPQIWAETEHDAYFAFGYLHAADRLFQMDMTRRVAEGRLSELLGAVTLEMDKYQRTIGHERLARLYLDRVPVDDLRRLKAYTEGVNYYVENCGALPFEYQLLGQDFEPWRILDCVTIFSFQTWFSNFMMSPDAAIVKMLEKSDSLRIKELLYNYPDWAPFTVPQVNNLRKQDDKTVSRSGNPLTAWIRDRAAAEIIENSLAPFLMSRASNSWVTAPERGKNGAAIFASDPHLDITRLPQFWYFLGLHIEEDSIDALGISTPGLPFLVMGHNRKIAYAFTVGGIDVNEYYMEKINIDTSAYLTPDGWLPFEHHREIIKVSGQARAETLDVKISRHGPLVFQDDSLKHVYTLKWAGFDANLALSVSAGFDLITADNFEDFRRGVTSLGALDANWTYADINGNIGYQLGTPIAIRPQITHNLPVPGWTEEYDWQGYYPLEKTPHAYNPSRGWLATCNNKQDEKNLDYELPGYFAADRILRINNLLQSQEKFSVENMRQFQLDLKDRYLVRWARLLSGLVSEAGQAELAAKLTEWDGSTERNSKVTPFIHLFMDNFSRAVFEDELGELEKRINKYNLEEIFKKDSSGWFDNVDTPDSVETKRMVVRQALNQTLNNLKNETWGKRLSLTMKHPFSFIPVLSGVLGLEKGPYAWHGSAGTLNASFTKRDQEKSGYYKVLVAPSWRFVLDFSDIDQAAIVLPAGNSGNPCSRHFMDFFELWKNGQYWTVPSSREGVRACTVSTLHFNPVKKEESK